MRAAPPTHEPAHVLEPNPLPGYDLGGVVHAGRHHHVGIAPPMPPTADRDLLAHSAVSVAEVRDGHHVKVQR